jgi:hypothetical protein
MTKSKKKVLYIDMDGVVADFLGFSVTDPSGTNLDFGSVV